MPWVSSTMRCSHRQPHATGVQGDALSYRRVTGQLYRSAQPTHNIPKAQL